MPSEGRTKTGPEHYLRAEEILSGASKTYPDPVHIAMAQAHATLALAAATAMASDFGNRTEADGWRQAAGSSMTS